MATAAIISLIKRCLPGMTAARLAQDRLHRERQALLCGRLLARQVRQQLRVERLEEVEFSVFSQFGDDGIIQWLAARLDLPHRTFIEFGVADYQESNTRFLLMNDNWSGYVMDGSAANVGKITGAEYYWRHDLQARAAFIDTGNINGLLRESGFPAEVGVLHVDLDGNDYWVWKEIDAVSPIVVILEYNSVFGAERAISVPYSPAFHRTAAHHSNLYFGASLPAMQELSLAKGYAFIGCNSAGNNAYFVRRDHLNDSVREIPISAGFVASRYRESRDPKGRLTYLRAAARAEAIRGLPVVDVRTGRTEAF